MLESFGKFIDGVVRPVVTVGLLGVIAYKALLAVDGSDPVVQAVITLAGVAMTFWFGNRTADKAADAAIARAAEATVTVTTPPVTATTETVTTTSPAEAVAPPKFGIR